MIVVLTVLVSACGPKAPATRFEAIKEAGKIVVGTSADYEPWEYKDADDNFVGIDMDIMREIGKRMGVEVEFQDLGFDALVQTADNLMRLKYMVRNIVSGYGHSATFMPKPLWNDNGSGLHLRLNLWKDQKPLL